MQTTSPFHLGFLPEEYCWSLFKHFAFGKKEAMEDANLLKIGHGIIKKCKGSPLAIKALGGILRYENDVEKWREVLDSDIPEIDESGAIMPALLLSYWKLRLHLRPCFLYLSMFPKGKRFEKDTVVRLWMAQGYIFDNTRNLKTLEEIGGEYFNELQSRSLIECGHFNNYFLHDLIHDLARYISQGSYQYVLENAQLRNRSCKVHHLYLNKQHQLSNFLAMCNPRSIRTIVKTCTTSQLFDYVIFSEVTCVRALHLGPHVTLDALGTLKHLRYMYVTNHETLRLPESLCLLYNLQTLHLSCNNLQELPKNMKNLINLQYLHLNSTKIVQLHESIFQLQNLHTLSFRYCVKLKELPRGIGKLMRLRNLDLPDSLIMPCGIGQLTTLKNLNGNFIVMNHGMIGGLGELKDMNMLSGLLCISGLKNIGDVDCSANLASKPNINKLFLNFDEEHHVGRICRETFKRDNCDGGKSGEQVDALHLSVNLNNVAKIENVERKQEGVLESLRPCGTITELKILHYKGKTFPSWLLNSLLSKLIAVTIDCCSECIFTPPFGQLAYLKFLKITGSSGVKKVGDKPSTYLLLANGFSKQPTEVSFPSLEVLSLMNMLCLEWQTHDGDFPCLKDLAIKNCPKLWKIATISRKVRRLVIGDSRCHEIQFLSQSKIQEVLIFNCGELISVHSMDRDLPILEKISIISCPQLRIFPTIPQKVEILTIRNCGFHELMLPSKFENLTISNCPELISIDWRDDYSYSTSKVAFEYCPELRILTIPSRTKKLNIDKCGLREIIFPSISENLTISNCLELISVTWTNKHSNFIDNVSFECCPKLDFQSIPSVIFNKLKIHKCGIREITLPSKLKNLTISNCQELISIDWGNGGLNFLAEVIFEQIPELKLLTIPLRIKKLKIQECGFREIAFQTVSENLTISNCLELISVTWMDEHYINSIDEVTLEYCPKLVLSTVPKGIKKLKISYCGIQEIVFPFQSRIKMVDVSHCPLTSIRWSERDMSFSTELINNCPELNEGLKNLQISHCSILQFPVESLLHSMTEKAEIYGCPRMNLGRRLVYQRDARVKDLNVFGNKEINLSHASANSVIPLQENFFALIFTKEESLEVESLTCPPLVGCQCIFLNLSSLVTLEISWCKKFVSLTGLHNLSKLSRLSISYCRELCDWNDRMLPVALQFLELECCDKLQSVPLLSVKNQSSNLKSLAIISCPMLSVLEGFNGLMNLRMVELLYCRNISISPATEKLNVEPHISIINCPLLKDWCQRNSITYYKLEGWTNEWDFDMGYDVQECSERSTDDAHVIQSRTETEDKNNTVQYL